MSVKEGIKMNWNLFRKRRQPEYLAVIEGTFHDEWRNLQYKLSELSIPEGTTVVNDGVYDYIFYGRSEDFQTVQIVESSESPVLTTKSLISSDDVILERPRAVYTKDGRVFVEKNMLSDAAYLETIPEMLYTTRENLLN